MNFTYAAFKKTGTDATEGDCQTLSEMFVARAVAAGIPESDIKTKSMKESSGSAYFVKGGGAVLDSKGKTGNVDNGRHWRFVSHTWVEHKGTPIDVLFKQFGVKSAKKYSVDRDDVGEVDGLTIYPTSLQKAGDNNKYTTNAADALTSSDLDAATKGGTKSGTKEIDSRMAGLADRLF